MSFFCGHDSGHPRHFERVAFWVARRARSTAGSMATKAEGGVSVGVAVFAETSTFAPDRWIVVRELLGIAGILTFRPDSRQGRLYPPGLMESMRYCDERSQNL